MIQTSTMGGSPILISEEKKAPCRKSDAMMLMDFIIGWFGDTNTVMILVGGFNPFEKYHSKWESFPNRGENLRKNWNHHPRMYLLPRMNVFTRSSATASQGVVGKVVRASTSEIGCPTTGNLYCPKGKANVSQFLYRTTWNAKCPNFFGNLTPKTSNYCLKNRALGFPGIPLLNCSFTEKMPLFCIKLRFLGSVST